jgi:hypothetical protein
MKTKYLILLILIWLLLPNSFICTQGFVNNGAHFFTEGKTYITISNGDFLNLSGEFKLKIGSTLTATNNISNGGIFNIYDSSNATVYQNFHNTLSATLTGSVTPSNSSKITVKKNFINDGGVINGHIIEVGE